MSNATPMGEPTGLAHDAKSRDQLAAVWKDVERAIYQGPDSALPEVISVLQTIPEVIALAASRERETTRN